jgi:hypothetical protein
MRFDVNCKSNITEFYSEIKPIIFYEKSEDIALLLNRLTLSSKTYSKALDEGELDQEYCNDRDENGYLIGIELDLSESKFISHIKANSYRIYETTWRNKNFRMVTFENKDTVFDINNIIYPLTNENDAFIVVKIESRYKIGIITALITCREDLYPTEYLIEPQFMLNGIYK